jgi:hypothetical protein
MMVTAVQIAAIAARAGNYQIEATELPARAVDAFLSSADASAECYNLIPATLLILFVAISGAIAGNITHLPGGHLRSRRLDLHIAWRSP